VNLNKNSNSTVVIFGASGFVGRYIVAILAKEYWTIKVFVRKPDQAKHLTLIGKLGQVTIYQGNISNKNSVDKIIYGANKVINLVGILEENNKQNFSSVHIGGSTNIAESCLKHKINSLIHISALGIYDGMHSKYAKSKLEAEQNIKKIFQKTIILRPSVIFGPEDNFTNKFARMASISPFIPLINNGLTKFQPVYVKDVAKAVSAVINNNFHLGKTYNLGGPEIISFKEIIDFVLLKIRKKRIYFSLSFPMAKLIGIIFSIVPVAPITLDQVRLLEKDNIVPEKEKGFKELGIKPSSIYLLAEEYLNRYISRY
jgi:NADH dehydrogenase